MARLESVKFSPHYAQTEFNSVKWTSVISAPPIDGFPIVFWHDDTPWKEANLWLMEETTTRKISLSTTVSRAASLLSYAKWLEKQEVSWLEFPVRARDRCLVRYRGYLIKARDDGHLAPSTATQRMQVTIRFYRWLRDSSMNLSTAHLWEEGKFSEESFSRTMDISASQLRIQNRTIQKEHLEDGLLPLSSEEREQLLSFCKQNSSQELFLMLLTAFFTGMRLGTISDLKISTIQNAVSDSSGSGLFRLALGPGASPPVSTKFGITGHCWITKENLEILLDYIDSPRRLLRQAKAPTMHKELVFLTKFGGPYARGPNKSPAVNVELHKLRKKADMVGVNVLKNFHFHQTRCTFATELAQIALKMGDVSIAIAIVMQALLHRNESSTLHYIKFAQKLPIKIEAANSFTRAFLGLVD
jgi:integrase